MLLLPLLVSFLHATKGRPLSGGAAPLENSAGVAESAVAGGSGESSGSGGFENPPWSGPESGCLDNSVIDQIIELRVNCSESTTACSHYEVFCATAWTDESVTETAICNRAICDHVCPAAPSYAFCDDAETPVEYQCDPDLFDVLTGVVDENVAKCQGNHASCEGMESACGNYWNMPVINPYGACYQQLCTRICDALWPNDIYSWCRYSFDSEPSLEGPPPPDQTAPPPQTPLPAQTDLPAQPELPVQPESPPEQTSQATRARSAFPPQTPTPPAQTAVPGPARTAGATVDPAAATARFTAIRPVYQIRRVVIASWQLLFMREA
jgi:hypothetical protein